MKLSMICVFYTYSQTKALNEIQKKKKPQKITQKEQPKRSNSATAVLLQKTLYITSVETGLTQLASAPWNTQIKHEVYIFAVDITQFPFVLSFCVLFFFF